MSGGGGRLFQPLAGAYILELITQRSLVQIQPPQTFKGIPTHFQPIETGACERPSSLSQSGRVEGLASEILFTIYSRVVARVSAEPYAFAYPVR